MHSYYSQKGTIIRALQDCGPQKVSFFMKGRYFAGYKIGLKYDMNDIRKKKCKRGSISEKESHIK